MQEEEIAPYSTEVGKTLWHFLTTLGKELFELGVYLTNEWQDNQSWRSLVEEVGDPWNFEMAIFPRKLAPFFQNVPAGFQGTVVEGGFGFAQANRFITLPWT
ncbi:hypothetical protein [Tengunoibacter tsumagoiensis]|uniref:Uncharacterized protein n=1 Tax=Tengunoibacter tsumagoiensis TaxID=2014871 RepID=A0A401ZVW4_9CHLR|nr:hypothetical protein [Tengunoibacter tsumagoiensis]GCE11048.1 hypothetical protein KTT_09070 [Tengunoibacter tsumagoiensis]